MGAVVLPAAGESRPPRIAVWRKLKRLGVAQIRDGLAALPVGPRTREQLEWMAEEVADGGGSAAIWLARPATRPGRPAGAGDGGCPRRRYQAVIVAAAEAADGDPAALAYAVRRLRNELRGIQRRDYFPAAERDQAQAALQELSQPRQAARRLRCMLATAVTPAPPGKRHAANRVSQREVGDPGGHPHRPGGMRMVDPPPRR